MKFERLVNKTENAGVNNDVMKQLENLGLTMDDIKGSILDVGAGEGMFASELKKVSNAEIVSVNDYKNDDAPEDMVIADVRKLPFADNVFDRVISHASIPNVFIGMYSEDFPELSEAEIKNSILKSFREILRVLKPGSKATMAPVRIANNYDAEKALARNLMAAIEEIREESADVIFELIREVEDPHNQERHRQYRLTLFSTIE